MNQVESRKSTGGTNRTCVYSAHETGVFTTYVVLVWVSPPSTCGWPLTTSWKSWFIGSVKRTLKVILPGKLHMNIYPGGPNALNEIPLVEPTLFSPAYCNILRFPYPVLKLTPTHDRHSSRESNKRKRHVNTCQLVVAEVKELKVVQFFQRLRDDSCGSKKCGIRQRGGLSAL